MASTTRKLSAAQLVAKVEWEGGVLDTIEYGIHSDEIADEGLASAWAEAEAAHTQLTKVVERITKLLDAHTGDRE
jgi:hypothetical protein